MRCKGALVPNLVFSVLSRGRERTLVTLYQALRIERGYLSESPLERNKGALGIESTQRMGNMSSLSDSRERTDHKYTY